MEDFFAEGGGCRSTYIGCVTTLHSRVLPGSLHIVASLLWTRSSFQTTTFRLTSRSVLLHEGLASLNGDSGKTRMERSGFCWRASTSEAVDKVVL